jgi:hypothetical protein
MSPITIDAQLVEVVEHHVNASVDDKALLQQVATACPSASLKEISRAALYAATDVSREDVRVSARLYYFTMNVRKAA